MDEHKLITLVENNSFIYDKKSKDFKNINKKREAWAAIAKELGCNVDVCERRWTSLRERFSKESRIVDPSGSGVGMSSEWVHFQSLQFLKSHLQRRRQKSNFKVLEESHTSFLENDDILSSTLNVDDIIVESPIVDIEVPSASVVDASPAPSRKREGTDTHIDDTLSQATAVFKEYCDSMKAKETEDEVAANMGNIVKKSLSAMTPRKKMKVSSKIMQLLSEEENEEN